MYPKIVFLGMGFYEIFLTLGMLTALYLGDKLGIKRGLSVKAQRLLIIGGVIGVLLGLFGAMAFQAFYDYLATKEFHLFSSGLTFYGGLIFGAAAFLLIWFVGGNMKGISAETKAKFKDVADIAACVVPLAHGLGRFGCLFAGCCHGKATNAWYGVTHYGVTTSGELISLGKYVPVQLFEAVFLLALSAVLFYLFFKRTDEKRIPLLPVYCIAYAIWRFLIEYARADDRGVTIIPGLTPSQLTAVVLCLVGIGYFVVWYVGKKKTAACQGESVDGVAEKTQENKEE
ncbi:MAG: prolipoprotein diacylglyceryl transferase [Clostridia bacterium]|nr:prolipoprotein diacylglyceryl transferase [Clostridia bacterium]